MGGSVSFPTAVGGVGEEWREERVCVCEPSINLVKRPLSSRPSAYGKRDRPLTQIVVVYLYKST
eukprot:scaffold70486_cov35-Tisochrysis_lutea.AAC.2